MGLGPGRKLRDEVDLAKELSHHLAGVVSLTERVEVRQEVLERVLGPGNRDIGVVLTLPLEMSVMFEELFPVEVAETLAARSKKGNLRPRNLDAFEATLHGHL